MVGWWVQGSYKAIYWRISESMNGNPVLTPTNSGICNLELFCKNFCIWHENGPTTPNFPRKLHPLLSLPGPKTPPRLSAQLSPRLPLGPLQWRRRRGLGSHLTGHEETGGGTEVEVRRLGEELPGWHFFNDIYIYIYLSDSTGILVGIKSVIKHPVFYWDFWYLLMVSINFNVYIACYWVVSPKKWVKVSTIKNCGFKMKIPGFEVSKTLVI